MRVSSKSMPSSVAARSQQPAEFKPCLWKLLVVTAGILASVFVAMQMVDDTYVGSFDTKVSTQQTQKAG
ncbi:hypothetical protein [Rhizobium sp. ZW T2_16]|uniref:hypothetical protein n=1 Tax=Rhizobium sp. ZW T2_16 TaxID=3378083 RepID=UPI003854D3DE